MFKAIMLVLIMVIAATSLSIPSALAMRQENVQVRIPTFPVWLNGLLVNQINNRYPFIVYRDVTYFPMTWTMSRFMGLETAWTAARGLAVYTSSRFAPYETDQTVINDTSVDHFATIVNFAVTTNGERIKNSASVYPLLLFRDVTYFPLTWNMAQEFFWQSQWSPERGLDIHSANFTSGELESVITLLNRTAFGPGYSFAARLTLPSQTEPIAFSGRVTNRLVQPRLRKAELLTPSDFVSTVTLNRPLHPFLTINEWKKWTLWQTGDDVFVGRNVTRFERLPTASSQTSRYRLFFGPKGEPLGGRIIEAEINWTTRRVTEVWIQDVLDTAISGDRRYSLIMYLSNTR